MYNKLGLGELAKGVIERGKKYSVEEMRKLIKSLFDVIKRTCHEGRVVTIKGFGRFETKALKVQTDFGAPSRAPGNVQKKNFLKFYATRASKAK